MEPWVYEVDEISSSRFWVVQFRASSRDHRTKLAECHIRQVADRMVVLLNRNGMSDN